MAKNVRKNRKIVGKTKTKLSTRERRCWETTVGNKKRLLCNDDKINKRKIIRNDVYNYLDNCSEANIDERKTNYLNAESINYGVQVGAITKVKCLRRGKRRDCREVKFYTKGQKYDSVTVCDDDPPSKKVDIQGSVDLLLTGCTRARFWRGKNKKDTFKMERVGGLSGKDRRMAGKFVIEGDITRVRCILKTKKTVG